MAMPTSGCIAIKDNTIQTCSSICAAVGGVTGSLCSLSITAGKSAPHCMREFYGYSSALPLSLTTTSCSQSSNVSYHCGRIDGMSTTGHYATLTIRYDLRGSACKGACSFVALVCNGTTVCTCTILATSVIRTGTWSEYMDYNDSICFVTCTDSGLVIIGGSSITQATLSIDGITQGVGTYCIGSPDSISSTSTVIP